jgi:acyl carrier protein
MKTDLFLKKLQEALEEDTPINTNTNFSELSNFDSMSIMILIAFIDENFNEKIPASQFKEIKDIKGLINSIGVNHFD